MKLFDAPKTDVKSTLLVDRYITPPFSILDARQGYWQSRKQKWISMGIKSEIGRKEDFYNYKDFFREGAKSLPNVSIFDPVLCECIYLWFSKADAEIFDPFAGGSVRGVVAGALQRHYTGIDLRKEQIDANNTNYDEICENYTNIIKPTWLIGNSLNCKALVGDKKFDMLFTCPPYYDLEVYSDDPEDLSNFDSYDEFIITYKQIFKESYDLIKDDSFAVLVVADIRDSKGAYRGFVADTIKLMQECGYKFYNDAILFQNLTTVPRRTPKQFDTSRKMGKCHQNLLVFYKGDIKNIKDKFGPVNIENNLMEE